MANQIAGDEDHGVMIMSTTIYDVECCRRDGLIYYPSIGRCGSHNINEEKMSLAQVILRIKCNDRRLPRRRRPTNERSHMGDASSDLDNRRRMMIIAHSHGALIN